MLSSYVSDAVMYFQETTKQKMYPPESPANSITVVLFCLLLMILVYGKKTRQERSPYLHQLTPLPSQPAYNCSVENQALTEAQKDQQNRIHRIYAAIAGESFISANRPQKKGYSAA